LELVVQEEQQLLVLLIMVLEEELHHLEKFMQWVELLARIIQILVDILLSNLLVTQVILLRVI
jgi:hypothetical protein